MKSRLAALLLSSTLLAAPAAQAQYYYLPYVQANHNPGNLNTDSEDFGPPDPAWQVVLTGTAAMPTAPVWSPVQTLPAGFNFQFAGQAVRQFKVSSTGVLTFDVGATRVPPLQNVSLPSSLVPARSVCVWGLTMTANSSYINRTSYVTTRLFGRAPRRQFWVELRTFAPRNVSDRTNWAIVLEEGSNAIYVVDGRGSASLQLTVGVQVSAAQATEVVGSPTLGSESLYGTDWNTPASPYNNSYYTFRPGTLPTLDLEMERLEAPRYLVAGGGPLTIRGKLRSVGGQQVTSYTLGWQIDNGPVQTRAISGRPLGIAQADTFRLPTGWTPPAAGTYQLKCWVKWPNRRTDASAANDTLTSQLLVAGRARPRTVLLEMFTSSTCGPCLQGNQALDAVTATAPDRWVQIKYPQNFPLPGDPYTTSENVRRFQWNYGVSIPALAVDGDFWSLFGMPQQPQFSDNVLNYYRTQPAVLDLDAVYSVRNGVVTARAQLTPHLAVPAGQLVLHMAITEKSTTGNVATNGQTVFHDLMRKMLPNEFGTALGALTPGQSRAFQQTYTFIAPNTIESFDSLQVVVFVQDPVTHEVLQAVDARRNGILGVSEAVDPVALRIAPNPAAEQATVRFTLPTPGPVGLTLLDALGRAVREEPPTILPAGDYSRLLDLHGLRPGLYVVRLYAGATTHTRRLVVE